MAVTFFQAYLINGGFENVLAIFDISYLVTLSIQHQFKIKIM